MHYILSSLFNKWRELFQVFLSGVPLMLFAEPGLIPCARISAVAAPRDISFEPDPVSLVVALFEAFLADNAGGVLFAGLALPGDIPVAQGLGADTLIRSTLVLKGLGSQLMIDLTEQELLALVYILLEVPLNDLLINGHLLQLEFPLSEARIQDFCDLRGVRPDHRQEGEILLGRRKQHCCLF